MRRALRWIKRLVLGALALAVVAVIAVVVAAHTAWGREQIRQQVAAALARSFPGGARIGRVEGSPFGVLVLRDVELRDADGTPAVTARAIRIDVSWRALVGGDLALDALVLEGVRVRVRTPQGGAPNVATLYRPSTSSSGTALSIHRLELRDAAVVLEAGGRVDHLDGLAAHGGLAMAADGGLLAEATLTGTWRERGAPIAIAALVSVDAAGVVRVPSARADVGGAAVRLAALRYAGAGDVTGLVEAELADGALAALVPGLAAPAMVIAAAASSAGGAVTVRPRGRTAGAAVDGALTLRLADPVARLDGTLALTAIDLGRLWPGLPASTLAGELTLALRAAPGARVPVAGTLALRGAGAVAAVRLDDVRADVALADDVARVTVGGRGPGDTRLEASAAATAIADGWRVADGALRVATASLVAATAGASPIDGALTLDAHGAGQLGGAGARLAVTATTHGARLRAGALRIAAIDATITASGPIATPAIAATVTATGLRGGGQQVATVRATVRGVAPTGPFAVDVTARDPARRLAAAIDARVVPALARRPLRIELGGYQLAAPGAEVRGGGGVIEVDAAQITVAGVRARGAGGELDLDAALGRGPGRPPRRLRLALRDVDLARLRGVPGVPPAARGTVSARAELQTRGRAITGEVAVSGQGVVVVAGARPIEVAVSAELEPRTVAITVDGRGDDLGAVTAALVATPPRRLDDLAAWRALPRGALRTLRLDVDAVALAAIPRITGRPLPATGTARAHVALDAAGGQVRIGGAALAIDGAPTPVDVDVTIDLDAAGRAALTAAASATGLGTATATGAAHVPARPFDVAAWLALDVTALDGATVTIPPTSLTPALARRLGLPPVQGTAGATLIVGPRLASADLTITTDRLRAAPVTVPVTATITAHADGRGVTARAAIDADGRATLTATATTPTQVVDVVTGAVALAAVPVTGTATVSDGDLAALGGALGWPVLARGQVTGAATVDGTIGAPVATGTLTIDDLRLGGRGRGAGQHVELRGRFADGVAHAELHGQQADGGTLDVTAAAPVAALADARGTVRARGFELAPLARLAPATLLGVRGVLDADLQVTGGAAARVAGVARVTAVQVPLIDTLGTLRGGTIDATFAAGEARLAIGGAVEGGRLDARAVVGLDGLVPTGATVDVAVRELTLITSQAPRLDGDLHVVATPAGRRWKLTARLRDGSVTVPEGGGRTLLPAGAPADMVFTDDTAASARLPVTRATALATWLGTRPTAPRFEIDVTIEPVTVVSPSFRGEVSGALALLVGDDGATIDGRIRADRGTVLVLERRYRIDRAELDFDGSADPLLGIALAYQFPQLELHVGVDGRLSRPRLTLSSNPAGYTEGQLLGFVLGGSPTAPGQEVADTAAGVVATFVGSMVGGFVNQALPIHFDVLNYEPGTATSSGAVVLGRWLTSRLLLLVRTRVDARVDQNSSEAEAQYWLGPRLLIEGTAGNRGVLGLDLLWNRRW
ncbi:MAG: translocation/assembly module TamB domain-containing protein [Myxococcales bacterium]|nr:translocation/assembly module TamB domain-containing protein [Myxococcales bacterium]